MRRVFPVFFIAATSLFSCSLRYGMNPQDENSVPEFVFDDVRFNRYEDGNIKLSISAQKIEQYKDGKSMYAKDMDFKLFDENNKLSNFGKCGYLASDTDEKKYTLYDNIEITNTKDNLVVTAGSLRWNGKSEQLTSGRNSMVIIKKDDTIIQGAGFSASGVSRRFSFSGVVSGEANVNRVSPEKSEDVDSALENEVGSSLGGGE